MTSFSMGHAIVVVLTAFGFDSGIQLVRVGALLWRLVSEARGRSLVRME